MPEQKRALVVDDSKSARLVLRRMLEKHGLVVDAVESAQSALDFLNYNHPNVIFLDHMMPGMDGFQAIRAIKNNPATASIPVMMYTSKGGDLYLSQARALGAVGVLPKTVAPAELFQTLQRLGLVQERRSADSVPDDNGASERAEDILRQTGTPLPFAEPGMQQAAPAVQETAQSDDHVRKLLDEQRVEIRKDLLVGMETVLRQAGSKLAKELEERFPALDQPAPAPVVPLAPIILLIVLLFASLIWNVSLHRQNSDIAGSAKAPSVTAAAQPQQSTRSDVPPAEQSSAAAPAGWATIAWAMNQSLEYGYDEIALDRQRIDVVEQLLVRLADTGYRGAIVLETHAGDFCLLGDQDKGFRLPAPEMPVEQCEFIGNPVQPADSPGARQSLSFANFLSSTPLLDDSGMSLEVVAVSRTEPLFDYPPKSADTTAEQWNAVAALNNRISVRLEPTQQ